MIAHNHINPYIVTRVFYRHDIEDFLNNVIIIKTKVPLPLEYMTVADFGYYVYALWCYCSQTLLNYLAFQYFDIERT